MNTQCTKAMLNYIKPNLAKLNADYYMYAWNAHLYNDIDNLNDELRVIIELLNKLIKENSKSSMTQDEYNKKYLDLTNRYEKTQEKHNDIIKIRDDKILQALNSKFIISNLKHVDDKLSKRNEPVGILLIKNAIIHRNVI